MTRNQELMLAGLLQVKVDEDVSAHDVALDPRSPEAREVDAARRIVRPGTASVGHMKSCFHCGRHGGLTTGDSYKILGRRQYAHHDCRQKHVAGVDARRAIKAEALARAEDLVRIGLTAAANALVNGAPAEASNAAGLATAANDTDVCRAA